jgi:probable rRNA maturation factor
MKIHWDDRGLEPVPKPYYVTMKQAAIAALKQGFEAEELKNCELSISLVADAEMQELNKKYRDLDKTTDVLSFPTMEAPKGKIFPMGDIVISTQTAARQAEEYGHSYERELAFLTIHGVLHLMGLDHEMSYKDGKIMEDAQENILRELGLLS